MIKKNEEILMNEFNIKPNKYAAIAMAFTGLIAFVVLLLRELDIYMTNLVLSRISLITAIIILFIPLSLIFCPSLLEKRFIKYVIVGCSFISTLIVSVMLFFHATMFILFPLFLAMQYKSKRIGLISCIGTCIIALISPLIGYYCHLWDIEFLRYLIELCGAEVHSFDYIVLNDIKIFWGLLLYISLPRLFFVMIYSIFVFTVIKNGKENVNNLLKLNMINQVDPLTGLFNRNYYRDFINSIDQNMSVGVIFFDVNHLKTSNDINGHDYGDLLLARCADSIKRINSNNVLGFRYGGDEFMIIAKVNDETELDKVVALWKENLNTINKENEIDYCGMVCSMAYGTSIGKVSEIKELIHEADKIMYTKKGK